MLVKSFAFYMNIVGVDGFLYPYDVPRGAQSGLKFGPQFTIAEGLSYELVMDFNVSRSIVILGSKHHSIGYKLKPKIRVIAKAVTDSISGIVTNHEH